MTKDNVRRARRGRGGLRRRLLISFLLLSLIPLFASNAIGYGRSREILEDLVGRYLEGVADLQAAEVGRRVLQELQYLSAVAEGNRFLEAALERSRGEALHPIMSAEATPRAVAAYLERKRTETAHFAVLRLYAFDGSLVATTKGKAVAPPAGPIAVEDSLSLIPAGTPDAPPVLRVLAPVKNPAGETLGFLAGFVLLGGGHGFLDFPEHVAGAIESFVLDAEGRLVFVSHPHGHLNYQARFASPLMAEAGVAGRRGRYVNREGVGVLAVRTPVGVLGWTLLTEVPDDDALGALRRLRRLSLPLAALFSGLVLLGAWLLAGQIVAPVEHLVKGTRRIAAGDLGVRVPVPGDDELGDLATAFNEMAAELERSRERIRRLHQQEIERAEQLATVGELASGVAHEIKNPVVGISNGMDLVLRRVGDDPELQPIAREMQRELKRIQAAVRDLLAFARPPEPSPVPTDLNEVVERAGTLLEPVARQASVHLEFDFADGLPRVEVDPDLMAQAVVNLAMNAIQFSPEGGRVRVKTEVEDDVLRIVVRDEGEGVSNDVRAQLFKPFFTTRHSGTGLGLAITWGIVDRHGGRIEVENDPAGGAVFTIVFPRKDDGTDDGTDDGERAGARAGEDGSEAESS
ncbi:MAG: ATP-binding protein [Gemmatimonadota bacterium]